MSKCRGGRVKNSAKQFQLVYLQRRGLEQDKDLVLLTIEQQTFPLRMWSHTLHLSEQAAQRFQTWCLAKQYQTK